MFQDWYMATIVVVVLSILVLFCGAKHLGKESTPLATLLASSSTILLALQTRLLVVLGRCIFWLISNHVRLDEF